MDIKFNDVYSVLVFDNDVFMLLQRILIILLLLFLFSESEASKYKIRICKLLINTCWEDQIFTPSQSLAVS